MEHPCFAVDFCRFSTGMAADRVFGCVTELIWCEELSALLRFCGVPEREIDENASQYQRFRALCGVVPSLKGQRLPKFVSQLLKDIFDIDQPLCAETCDEIWKITSQKMMEADLTSAELFKRYRLSPKTGILCSSAADERSFTVGGVPVLDAKALMETEARDWPTWEGELIAACDRMEQLGCNRVYLRLDRAFRHQRVSPYHVDQALKSKTPESELVKMSQLLRLLSMQCRQRAWTLMLRIECPVGEILSAWEQLTNSVGLSDTVWSVADPFSVKALLQASAKLGHGNIRWALSVEDFPSQGELSRALEFYAARYPIGQLLVFSGVTLPYLPFEQARLIRALKDFYE